MENGHISGASIALEVPHHVKLDDLKRLIDENNVATRETDWFLDRFMSLSRQNYQSAFRKLQKYESFRNKHKEDWLKVYKAHVKLVLESKCIVVLDGCDKGGRKLLWVRLGKWEPENFTCDVILQVAALIAEIHLITHKFKPLSVIILFDMEDFGLKQLNALSSRFAKKMVHYLSECAPIEISSIFVLRESKLFSLIYSCFKPFLNETMKKSIHLFGHDIIALQEHMDIDQLPAELGGTCEDVTSNKWIKLMEKESIKKELTEAGYAFF